MKVLQQKICMIGAPGVGKTCLVRRFVHGIFDDSYMSTIGVKIDKRLIKLPTAEVHAMLWDIQGDTELGTLQSRYLQGAAGYILVFDSTRPKTYTDAQTMQSQIPETIPYVVLANKSDLAIWEHKTKDFHSAVTKVHTSAKTGSGVEEAISILAHALVNNTIQPSSP